MTKRYLLTVLLVAAAAHALLAVGAANVSEQFFVEVLYALQAAAALTLAGFLPDQIRVPGTG